jgi:hypothetical protein
MKKMIIFIVIALIATACARPHALSPNHPDFFSKEIEDVIRNFHK